MGLHRLGPSDVSPPKRAGGPDSEVKGKPGPARHFTPIIGSVLRAEREREGPRNGIERLNN